ncbi:hypothetical protein SLEP1_g5333 [Rubroshorea leprosula]|uniref:FMR1-interacting protein 1 conserved domain-containing protein n=1 Tax=Rubroshorea leprosula TaxID=152421 RepID=A0AAV5HRL8_9ROSI|nr:hypothetical protein SLEP1_g5333 [Rubroshorea leprosula]
MRPPGNSFPRQFRPKAPPPLTQQRQGFQSNPSLHNSSGMLQNSMPIPFGNANLFPFVNQAGFLNALQPNNHLGVPQFGSMLTNVGFVPQFGLPGMNNVSAFPQVQGQFSNPMQNGNQLNPSQLQGQFIPNLLNLAQQLNQNMGGQQLFFQNPMPTQIPNHSQFIPPYVIPSCTTQAMGCPNPNLLANMQSNQGEQGNQNKQNVADINGQKVLSVAISHVQEISSSTNSALVQPWQNQNLQPSIFMSQGNLAKSGQSFKNLQGKNTGRKASQWRSQKSQFHKVDDGKRKSRFGSEHSEKAGQGNERAVKYPRTDSAKPDREQRRSLALIYTENEIQQWREERKKNYPSKANIEKKLSGKLTDPEVAKIRREQLKEVLAKQAELGVEVAEIPSSYLSDSEKRVHGEERDTGGRFQRRNNRRGRFDKKSQFVKKQRLTDQDSLNVPSFNQRKPTLLEKLLSADIRKDKSRLLQVFRFMVMNSFFKDWPEKSLKFPLVVVKESGYEGDKVEEKSNTTVENISKHSDSGKDEADDHNGDGNDDNDINSNEDDDYKEEHDTHANQATVFVKEKATIQVIERDDEEEGEIID